MKINTRKIAIAGIIAAVYCVITVGVAPLSYGMMQLRISEALTILPVFTPYAIPGLFVGCLIANIMSPIGFVDMILGSLASLLAAYGTYKLKDKPWLAPLPPVLINGVIIGGMLYFYYGVNVSLPLCILWVSAGQGVVCYGLGMPLRKILVKYKGIFDTGN